MPSLRDAADAARDAIRYRREVGGDVAIANSHEAFDALLSAVDERLAMDELDNLEWPKWFGGSFMGDGRVTIIHQVSGWHTFPTAVAALQWVKAALTQR